MPQEFAEDAHDCGIVSHSVQARSGPILVLCSFPSACATCVVVRRGVRSPRFRKFPGFSTVPSQAMREGESFKPQKYFSIDRVFRNEALDATHLAEFHQVARYPCIAWLAG